MVLLGVFAVNPWLAALSALGLIGAAIYALIMLQQSFQGAPGPARNLPDDRSGELLVMGSMMLALLLLGLYPQPVLDLAMPLVNSLYGSVGGDLALAGDWR